MEEAITHARWNGLSRLLLILEIYIQDIEHLIAKTFQLRVMGICIIGRIGDCETELMNWYQTQTRPKHRAFGASIMSNQIVHEIMICQETDQGFSIRW